MCRSVFGEYPHLLRKGPDPSPEDTRSMFRGSEVPEWFTKERHEISGVAATGFWAAFRAKAALEFWGEN